MTNVEKYKSDLKTLVDLGDKMSFGLLLGPDSAEKHVKGGKRSQVEKILDEYAAKARVVSSANINNGTPRLQQSFANSFRA